MRKRIYNIVRRLCEGDEFYTNASPRITLSEVEEVRREVGVLQIESEFGAERPSRRCVYPLFYKEFIESAKRLGVKIREAGA